MGFIDWHGTKEDHFEDVLEYAKDRKKEEIRAQEEKVIRKWMGDKLGDPRYGQIKSTDCVKLLAKEYIALDQLYTDLIRTTNVKEIKFVPMQLWKDLWMATIESVIEDAGIQDQKKVAGLRCLCPAPAGTVAPPGALCPTAPPAAHSCD